MGPNGVPRVGGMWPKACKFLSLWLHCLSFGFQSSRSWVPKYCRLDATSPHVVSSFRHLGPKFGHLGSNLCHVGPKVYHLVLNPSVALNLCHVGPIVRLLGSIENNDPHVIECVPIQNQHPKKSKNPKMVWNGPKSVHSGWNLVEMEQKSTISISKIVPYPFYPIFNPKMLYWGPYGPNGVPRVGGMWPKAH